MLLLRNIITLATTLFFGIFIGYFGRNFCSIEFKKELGLGDLLNFSVTIVFAFVIQNYLQKRFGDNRLEKDHIIRLIGEVISNIKESKSRFDHSYKNKKISGDDSSEILASTKNISNSLILVKESLDKCGYKTDSEKVADVLKTYLSYKKTITGGSFPSQAYSAKTSGSADKYFNQMLKGLNTLILDLNSR